MAGKLYAELRYEITCDLGEVQNIGKTQYGTRGIILPNCAGEWGMTRPDGVGRLDAHRRAIGSSSIDRRFR